MKGRREQPWSRIGSAALGAFLGLVSAMIYQIHRASTGEIPVGNPLAHLFAEFAGFTLGGALLLAMIGEIRNRL